MIYFDVKNASCRAYSNARTGSAFFELPHDHIPDITKMVIICKGANLMQLATHFNSFRSIISYIANTCFRLLPSL